MSGSTSHITTSDSAAWIGVLPTNWNLLRLKFSVDCCQNGIWGEDADGGEYDIPCVRVADFDRTNFSVPPDIPTIRKVSPSERRGRMLRQGDLLLEKSGGGEQQPVGAVVLYDQRFPAVCSNFVARMAPSMLANSRYFRYVHATLYALGINRKSIKQTTGIQNLDADAYLNELAPFPPLLQQQAIAAFLDRKTAQIDELIGKKERQIELLQEKRQALISQAVTKGLDPKVKMKDSGVEWLGKLPAHWVIKRLKLCIRSGSSISYGIVQPGEHMDNGTPFVQTTNMTGGRFELDMLQRTTPEIAAGYPRSRLRGGDVILGIRASIGAAHVVPDHLTGANLSRGVARIVTATGLESAYLVSYLRSSHVTNYWQMSRQGSTFNEVSIETVRELPVVLPPINEQRSILRQLDWEMKHLDSFVTAVITQLDKLCEYRQTLISAAVTGKIDVGKEVA